MNLLYKAEGITVLFANYISYVITFVRDTYSKSPCTREWPNLKEAVAKLLMMDGLTVASYLLLCP